jgi:hypothetical protein
MTGKSAAKIMHRGRDMTDEMFDLARLATPTAA